MIRILDFTSPELSVPEWQINAGEAWCVVGANGSGKQFVDQLLLGLLAATPPESVTHDIALDSISLVSFEQQQTVFENELKLAATDLLPESETATLTASFLPPDRLDEIGRAHV